MGQPRSVNHHYVPQFLQRGWADTDGLVDCYDRSHDTWRRVAPKSVGRQAELYTIESGDGPSHIVERQAMGAVDAVGAAVANAIRAGSELPPAAADALRVLVGAAGGRHPAVQAGLRELVAADLEREVAEAFATVHDDERWHAFVQREIVQGAVAADWDQLRASLTKLTPADFTVEPNASYLVGLQLGSVLHLGRDVLSRYAPVVWELDVDAPARFLLADKPVLALQLPGLPSSAQPLGAAADAHAFLLPVGPLHAVVFERHDLWSAAGGDEARLQEVAFATQPDDVVRDMNRAMLHAADRFVWAVGRSLDV